MSMKPLQRLEGGSCKKFWYKRSRLPCSGIILHQVWRKVEAKLIEAVCSPADSLGGFLVVSQR